MKKILYFILFLTNFPICTQSEKQDSILTADILSNSSNYYNLLETKKYKDISEKKLTELIKSEKKLIQIFALNRLGINYRRKNKLDKLEKAFKYHKKALNLAEEAQNIEAQIHTLNLLGFCSHLKLNLRNSLDYHQKVLKLTSEIKNPSKNILNSKGIAQNNIGEVYRELKQYRLAIEQFNLAIEIQNKLGNIKELAINYGSLGKTYESNGSYDKAMRNFLISLKYNDNSKNDFGKVICNNHIATILIEQGKYEEARKTIESNFLNALNLNNNKYLARTLAILGRSQKKIGNLQAAETNLLKSYDLYQKLEVKGDGYSNLCNYLSNLYELKKDYKASLLYYKKGIEYKTSSKQNILYIGNLISRYDSQSKKIKIKQLEEKTRQQMYENSRTRNLLLITLVSIAFLSVALYSVYRQRLLNNDKKLLNLEQEALQAQMNPHFIFNALNSIKLYIINNDQRQAVYYLNKFAKLIRTVLDTSRKKEISLQNELETMELYVSIENIRFNNVIEYNYNIKDKNLNLNTIKIPPLLLQPFLENAIWHGLSSKEGDYKKVTLTVSKISSELIEIGIADNGVGRSVAMEIKKNKSLKRKSVGVDLTEERLKNFAKDFNTESYVRYIDLKDVDGNSLGTEVVLGIPLV